MNILPVTKSGSTPITLNYLEIEDWPAGQAGQHFLKEGYQRLRLNSRNVGAVAGPSTALVRRGNRTGRANGKFCRVVTYEIQGFRYGERSNRIGALDGISADIVGVTLLSRRKAADTKAEYLSLSERDENVLF